MQVFARWIHSRLYVWNNKRLWRYSPRTALWFMLLNYNVWKELISSFCLINTASALCLESWRSQLTKNTHLAAAGNRLALFQCFTTLCVPVFSLFSKWAVLKETDPLDKAIELFVAYWTREPPSASPQRDTHFSHSLCSSIRVWKWDFFSLIKSWITQSKQKEKNSFNSRVDFFSQKHFCYACWKYLSNMVSDDINICLLWKANVRPIIAFSPNYFIYESKVFRLYHWLSFVMQIWQEIAHCTNRMWCDGWLA